MHEYAVVKTRAGLFAMQHKSVLRLTGSDAGALVERLLCGDVRNLPTGQERFSPMLNYQGGIMESYPDVEVEAHSGGQPIYYYVVSVDFTFQ